MTYRFAVPSVLGVEVGLFTRISCLKVRTSSYGRFLFGLANFHGQPFSN